MFFFFQSIYIKVQSLLYLECQGFINEIKVGISKMLLGNVNIIFHVAKLLNQEYQKHIFLIRII